MTKQDCINRLETILAASQLTSSVYERDFQVSNWEKNGKSRTYFSIVETCSSSKHYVKKDYGYYDNAAGEYVPGKNDLRNNFTFSGSRF